MDRYNEEQRETLNNLFSGLTVLGTMDITQQGVQEPINFRHPRKFFFSYIYDGYEYSDYVCSSIARENLIRVSIVDNTLKAYVEGGFITSLVFYGKL